MTKATAKMKSDTEQTMKLDENVFQVNDHIEKASEKMRNICI